MHRRGNRLQHKSMLVSVSAWASQGGWLGTEGGGKVARHRLVSSKATPPNININFFSNNHPCPLLIPKISFKKRKIKNPLIFLPNRFLRHPSPSPRMVTSSSPRSAARSARIAPRPLPAWLGLTERRWNLG